MSASTQPQFAAVLGIGTGNLPFDGPGGDEDFGQEQVSGNEADRYKFRTAHSAAGTACARATGLARSGGRH